MFLWMMMVLAKDESSVTTRSFLKCAKCCQNANNNVKRSYFSLLFFPELFLAYWLLKLLDHLHRMTSLDPSLNHFSDLLNFTDLMIWCYVLSFILVGEITDCLYKGQQRSLMWNIKSLCYLCIVFCQSSSIVMYIQITKLWLLMNTN